ncbi:polysaccharide pyruvyl transferase family protein [Xanthobacter aminoxidans]|uniref:polysaccharide pyruvyl transferase family protein n=1 Tax=Xanthobacter aminoxidans TaxID=186280 RepID=UPI003729A4AC
MNERVLFAGNSSYANKGCEAIVRGTREILLRSLGDGVAVDHAYFPTDSKDDRAIETDPGIHHVVLPRWKKFSAPWFRFQLAGRLDRARIWNYYCPPAVRAVSAADVVLMIGGDNYTLDYGVPRLFYSFHEMCLRARKPTVLWGASIGPFTKNPEFEKRAAEQMRRMDLILARESITIDYLASIGVSENVRRVNDPSFCMTPVKPNLDPELEAFLARGCIGINLSPLVGLYELPNIEAWIERAKEVLAHLHATLGLAILLVPHVIDRDGQNIMKCDDLFMKAAAADLIAAGLPVRIAPASLSAAQVKWVIGQTQVYAGARMHSTAAGASTHVPTVFITYSNKATGMARDIYGDDSMLVDGRKISKERLAEVIGTSHRNREQISAYLRARMPDYASLSWAAGDYVRDLLRAA